MVQGAMVRGIRGAIDVAANDPGEILEATKQLLVEMTAGNSVSLEDICAVYFTMTQDLNAVHPAEAARQLGWKYVPLFCSLEIDVPGSLPRCIRVLILINSSKKPEDIRHFYLKGAMSLRQDLLTQ